MVRQITQQYLTACRVCNVLNILSVYTGEFDIDNAPQKCDKNIYRTSHTITQRQDHSAGQPGNEYTGYSRNIAGIVRYRPHTDFTAHRVATGGTSTIAIARLDKIDQR